jgi:nitroimidazol reductase NimA-like FMN-containing flavoprotein (pyridoxamine 5'-phosphate oxidase superfamily)
MGMQRGRPLMPGYGIERGDDGLIEWDIAERRLASAHNYWIATVRPDGRPHAMPVWAAWCDGALWFSSGLASRKIRNLRANPACTVTTEGGAEPVIVDGTAEFVTEPTTTKALQVYRTKYNSSLEQEDSAIVRVTPIEIFALEEARFLQSPTRWRSNP